MYPLTLIIASVFLCFTSASPIGQHEITIIPDETTIIPDANERIHGGSPAYLGQFPYIVSLRTRGSHFCGGSIISAYWIVSAAHCVVDFSASAITVVTGTTSIFSGGTAHSVSTTIPHPYYDPELLVYDISLIRTEQPIQFSDNVVPIALNAQEIRPGSQLTLAGWGITEEGDLARDLLWIELQGLSFESCQQMAPLPVFESNICTISDYGSGACNGDSGGPLTLEGVLVGVVSWGIPCALGYPDVFTKVASHVDWIRANAN